MEHSGTRVDLPARAESVTVVAHIGLERKRRGYEHALEQVIRLRHPDGGLSTGPVLTTTHS